MLDRSRRLAALNQGSLKGRFCPPHLLHEGRRHDYTHASIKQSMKETLIRPTHNAFDACVRRQHSERKLPRSELASKACLNLFFVVILNLIFVITNVSKRS